MVIGWDAEEELVPAIVGVGKSLSNQVNVCNNFRECRKAAGLSVAGVLRPDGRKAVWLERSSASVERMARTLGTGGAAWETEDFAMAFYCLPFSPVVVWLRLFY
jgi:hypothetical protein